MDHEEHGHREPRKEHFHGKEREWDIRHKLAQSIAEIMVAADTLRRHEEHPATRRLADAIAKVSGGLRAELEAALGYPTVTDVILLAERLMAKTKGAGGADDLRDRVLDEPDSRPPVGNRCHTGGG